jgi:hypothetical protein
MAPSWHSKHVILRCTAGNAPLRVKSTELGAPEVEPSLGQQIPALRHNFGRNLAIT